MGSAPTKRAYTRWDSSGIDFIQLSDPTGKVLSWIDSTGILQGNFSVAGAENIAFADQYSGASVGAQIDNASSSFNGTPGIVVIPSNMASGNSLVGVLDNIRIVDLRAIGGPNEFGSENQAFLKDVLLRARWTAAPNSTQNYQALQVYAEAAAGGENLTGGPKTNYAVIQGTMVARTPGQHNIFQGTINNFSQGDVIGIDVNAYGWGGLSAGGDQGINGASLGAFQGALVMTGTVSTVVGNTVSFSSSSNANTLGEGRILINTSNGVYSTGTITNITGTPPTVTGLGTTWTSLGSGAVSNLFFALDADVNGSFKYLIPIASITNDTTLVLNALSQALAISYNGAHTSGTYKIYKGSPVNTVAFGNGSVTVADGSQFSSADTVEQPLWYSHTVQGINLSVSEVLPAGGNAESSGINLSNVGTREMYTGISVAGPFSNGILFTGTFSTRQGINAALIRAVNAVGVGGAGPIIGLNDATSNANVILIQIPNNSSTNRNFTYDRQNDQWVLGSGHFSASDGRFGMGTNPQANTEGYIFLNNAAWDGLIVDNTAAPNAGVNLLTVRVSGVPRFAVQNTKALFNNGVVVSGYSDNQSTKTWSIDGSTGIATAGTFIESTSHTPSSASDTGTTGQIAWDSSFIYICTNTNTWKRVAIASW